MKASDTAIVIERTANGWIVRPYWSKNEAINLDEIHVFLNMDYDEHGATSEKTLWGFIAKHFRSGAAQGSPISQEKP